MRKLEGWKQRCSAEMCKGGEDELEILYIFAAFQRNANFRRGRWYPLCLFQDLKCLINNFGTEKIILDARNLLKIMFLEINKMKENEFKSMYYQHIFIFHQKISQIQVT